MDENLAENKALIDEGVAALTAAMGGEKTAAFLALVQSIVRPGDAVGAIEPPPTAPVGEPKVGDVWKRPAETCRWRVIHVIDADRVMMWSEEFQCETSGTPSLLARNGWMLVGRDGRALP